MSMSASCPVAADERDVPYVHSKRGWFGDAYGRVPARSSRACSPLVPFPLGAVAGVQAGDLVTEEWVVAVVLGRLAVAPSGGCGPGDGAVCVEAVGPVGFVLEPVMTPAQRDKIAAHRLTVLGMEREGVVEVATHRRLLTAGEPAGLVPAADESVQHRVRPVGGGADVEQLSAARFDKPAPPRPVGGQLAGHRGRNGHPVQLAGSLGQTQ